MKLLVSTTDTQGEQPGDFCFVPDGELVLDSFTCHSGASHCGCTRSLTGIDSRKCTTTFKVAEVDVDPGELRARVAQHMEVAGWLKGYKPTGQTRMINSRMLAVTQAADGFNVGDIIHRPHGQLQLRRAA